MFESLKLVSNDLFIDKYYFNLAGEYDFVSLLKNSDILDSRYFEKRSCYDNFRNVFHSILFECHDNILKHAYPPDKFESNEKKWCIKIIYPNHCHINSCAKLDKDILTVKIIDYGIGISESISSKLSRLKIKESKGYKRVQSLPEAVRAVIFSSINTFDEGRLQTGFSEIERSVEDGALTNYQLFSGNIIYAYNCIDNTRKISFSKTIDCEGTSLVLQFDMKVFGDLGAH